MNILIEIGQNGRHDPQREPISDQEEGLLLRLQGHRRLDLVQIQPSTQSVR